ncbi:hypothetical protein GLOTRDRAFT_129977 [Gloeophyllum trabeum ATCC 11539]|uniref:Uncharacterized protein n=1 Tax=Gloeophyllum trabeum (strain ATCC 11539 / FP-39264 / Madison 617) TaxID=670483 RepID=S7Q532_GLOTA|nr:uncharacterized protein GLOTRDRAFT_129977 [Gloeophyllum trabeum ATCC 11539]EPQ54623.1 hypothetical protein GLOTRDRAFT_129977 [Gloeophyllum trabeum ATCC 11539]
MPDKSSNPFRPSPQYPPQEYHHQPSPFLPPPQAQGMDPRAIPTGSAYSDRPPSYERAAHGRNPNYEGWQSGPVDYHREGVSPQMSYPPSYPPAQENGFPSQQGYDPSPHQPGPQAAHDWTGQPPPEQSPGFSLSSITKIFSGSSSNPLDPPPPCFSRPPPHNVSYEPFQTMVSYGLGKEIRDGFTQLPPPSMLQPHPFASHDIQEDDWHRFLSDVKKAGELSTRENITAAVLPLTMNIGLTGMLVSKAIKNGQSRRKQDPTSKLVDVWNHNGGDPGQRRYAPFGTHGSGRPAGRTPRTHQFRGFAQFFRRRNERSRPQVRQAPKNARETAAAEE